MEEAPLAILVKFSYLIQEERSRAVAVLVAICRGTKVTFQRLGHYGRTRYFHKAQALVLRQAVNLHRRDFFAGTAFSKQ